MGVTCRQYRQVLPPNFLPPPLKFCRRRHVRLRLQDHEGAPTGEDHVLKGRGGGKVQKGSLENYYVLEKFKDLRLHGKCPRPFLVDPKLTI